MLFSNFYIEFTVRNCNNHKVARCITSNKLSTSYYFGILLMFIFLPLLSTFLWLYFHIATIIWMKTKSLDRIDAEITGVVYTTESQRNNLAHKLRTFKVILLLMIIFLLCRLPLWVFTVLQMAMVFNEPHHWVIYYVLNFIAYTNCALNPFLYAFLNETLHFGRKLRKCCCGMFLTNKKDPVST